MTTKERLKEVKKQIKFLLDNKEMFEATNKNTHCLYINSNLDIKQKTIYGFKVYKVKDLNPEIAFSYTIDRFMYDFIIVE